MNKTAQEVQQGQRIFHAELPGNRVVLTDDIELIPRRALSVIEREGWTADDVETEAFVLEAQGFAVRVLWS